MLFWVVSGVGRGMGVLDEGGDRRKGRAVLGVNVWRSIVTNGDWAATQNSGGLGLQVTQGHRQCHQSIERIWLPVRL